MARDEVAARRFGFTVGAMRTLVLFAAIATVAGCSKESKDSSAGLPPAQDWRDPASAPAIPQGGMGDPHAGMGNPHGGPHGGMADPHAGMADPTGVDVAAMGLPPPDPARARDSSKFLKGTIQPAAGLRDTIKAGSVVFVSVKRPDPKTGEPTGMPLAVERLEANWPLWFHISEEQQMIGGTDFSGEVVITAWTDQDQDAISKSPGDLTGSVRATIPAENLKLELDTVVQ